MAQHRDDFLFEQSTFLEGMNVAQPCSEVEEVADFTVGSQSGSEVIQVTQQQVSWVAASALLSCFLMFLGGYHYGKVHLSYRKPLPVDALLAEASLAQVGSSGVYSREDYGRYAVYEDAIKRCKELKNQGKIAGVEKKISRSVSGVERIWFLVGA